MSRRRFSRWIILSMEHDLTAIVGMARGQGMSIIRAYRYELCTWNEIALWGTPEQMEKAEEAWRVAGLSPLRRKPRGAWGINRDLPRAEWTDAQRSAP